MSFTSFAAPNVWCLTLAFASVSPAMAGSFVFSSIVVPGQTASSAGHITDRNEAVGSFEGVYQGMPGGGFLYSPDALYAPALTTITHPPAIVDFIAVNRHGTGIGFYQSANSSTMFIYDPVTRKQRPVAVAPKAYVEPFSINDEGAVVGDAYYPAYPGTTLGFLYAHDHIIPVHPPGAVDTTPVSIDDRGRVVGSYSDSARTMHGFIEETGMGGNGVYTSFDGPGATATYVYGQNSAGAIWGLYVDAARIGHGFILSNGQYRTIDFPGGLGGNIADVAPNGDVVGTIYGQNVTAYGFIIAGGVFHRYDAPLPGVSTGISSINASGSIAGFYYQGNDYPAPIAFVAICPKGQAPCLN